MSIVNNRYSGFKNYKDLLEYINEKIKYKENLKIVEIDSEFYAVGIETPNKQLIIGKEKVYYRNRDGYMISSNTDSFIAPYTIDDYTWTSFTSKLYDEYIEEVGYMNLYHIKGDKIILVDNPINCYFTFLINSFIDKFYTIDEFDYYDYSSYKNINIMKRDLLEISDVKVVAINPFKSKIKIKYKDEIIETKYRAIVRNSIDRNTDKHHSIVVGFQIKPIIEFVQTEDNYKTHCELNFETICNLRKYDNETIIKIFEMGKDYIKVLASNFHIDLNRKIIELLLHSGYDIKTYIENISNKRKNNILTKNAELIKYISEPTETMIRIAIENEYSSIARVKNLSIEMYEKLLNEYKECINYIDEMTIEIQEYFLNKDINNIKYFNKINIDILKKFHNKIKIDMLKNNNLKREFLRINNCSESDCGIKEDANKLLAKITDRYSGAIENLNCTKNLEVLIMEPEEPVNIHLQALSNIIKPEELQIATGFLYSSGLALIDNIIEKLVSSNKEVNIIIGSLREYKSGYSVNMDKNTAEYLNLFIDDGVKVKTYMEKFYHGKLYILVGKDISSVIIGSSNVSSGGFFNNYETNIAILFENYSEKLSEFKNYFLNIWNNSEDINKLDLEKFLDENLNFKDKDNFHFNDISEEIKRNFSYLIEKKPDSILENIQVFLGKSYEGEYCGFYFKRYSDLLILESLKYENAIYIFSGVNDVNEFVKNLKSKEVSINNKKFVNRINHTKDLTHINRVKEIIESLK